MNGRKTLVCRCCRHTHMPVDFNHLSMDIFIQNINELLLSEARIQNPNNGKMACISWTTMSVKCRDYALRRCRWKTNEQNWHTRSINSRGGRSPGSACTERGIHSERKHTAALDDSLLPTTAFFAQNLMLSTRSLGQDRVYTTPINANNFTNLWVCQTPLYHNFQHC